MPVGGLCPFVEVFTREKLSDEIRAKLAEELSMRAMRAETFGNYESLKPRTEISQQRRRTV